MIPCNSGPIFVRASTSLGILASDVWFFVERAAILFRTLLFGCLCLNSCTHPFSLESSRCVCGQPSFLWVTNGRHSCCNSGHVRRGQFVGTWRCHGHLRHRNSMLDSEGYGQPRAGTPAGLCNDKVALKRRSAS